MAYDPNNPLTLHYITTGAILPEKKENPKVVKKRKRKDIKKYVELLKRIVNVK
jgi:hypothetical protein|tara:strand:+ start:883 stop:1041 length:159 start_codon:yes stop_codon:yes gene_type:complete